MLLVAAAACTGDVTQDTVIADSAGLHLVTNRGADVPLDWRFERHLALGGRESGPEAFYEAGRGSVGSDSAGNIYVLDTGAHRVIVFDGEGNHLRTMGREGHGPGEIALPLGLTIRPDGTALVDDLGRGLLVVFAPDGTPSDAGERSLPGSRRAFWDGRHYLADFTTDSAGALHRLRLVDGSDTSRVAELRHPGDDRVIELSSCGMSFSGMPPIFAPDLRWDALGGRAAVRAGVAFEIDVYDDGRHTRRIRRSIDPLRATAQLAERDLGEAMTIQTSAGPRRCDPAEVVEKRGFAEALPAIRDLRVDPLGRIWVSRGGPRPEPTPTDILAPDGAYVGTLPNSIPYPIGFLPDGRALVAETDDVDVTRLVVYRVEEVPSGFEPE